MACPKTRRIWIDRYDVCSTEAQAPTTRDQERSPSYTIRLWKTFSPNLRAAFTYDCCPICQHATLHPFRRLTFPCSYTYCTACLTLWLQNSPHCPLCCKPYTLNLYPYLPGLTLALPHTSDPITTFLILVSAIFPTWTLLYLPVILVAYALDFGMHLTRDFLLLYPVWASWVGLAVHVLTERWWCPVPRPARGRSAWEVANATPFGLYVGGKEVRYPLWTVSAMVLMVSGLVARLGIELFLRFYERSRDLSCS